MGTTSAAGREFISGHEGAPLTAYLDPVGVPTIYKGFTNRSPTVTKTLGRIRPGVTRVTREQGEALFTEVLDKDYEPAVERGMPGALQHEFDAGVSVVYNLGPGAMNWQWAKLWRAGKKREAAAYLASHYNTAKGRVLPGLTRRRKEEAALLLDGTYSNSRAVPMAGQAVEVMAAQKILKALEIYAGKIDGINGPQTTEAVRAYQRRHPHLTVDGVLGPATMAQLQRESTLKEDAGANAVKGMGGAAIAAGGAIVAGVPWLWVGIGAVVIVAAAIGWFVWRNRDLYARKDQP